MGLPRRAALLAVLVTAVAIGSLAPGGAGAAGTASVAPAVAPAATAAADLPFDLVATTPLSERLSELRFRSPAADGGTADVRILLPDDYDDSGRTRYPVLLLLHGGGGSEDDWTVQGGAEAATAGLPLIVVMPGVTGHGNYVDWYNHGRGGPPMWDTFIIGQLLPWVDATYPTVGARHGRAVAGLSMGGGGAIGYAAHHPDVFVSAAAFSGAVDTNTFLVQLLAGTAGIEHGHEPGAVNGHRLTDEVRWRSDNPWDLAPNLAGVDLFLATGNGQPGGAGNQPFFDPVEQQCWVMMTNLHRRLTDLGIEHHWDDYGPGGHNWTFWSRELRNYLTHVLPVLAEQRPPPAVVRHHRSAEPTFGAFGWEVAMTRPAMEFAALADAGPHGFTVRGTGRAAVTTPPAHPPGSVWTVTVTDSAGSTSSTVVAGDDGRLRVAVDLGPGNPFQQYTIEGNLWVASRAGGRWPVRTATVTFEPAAAPAAEAPGAAPTVEVAATGGGGRSPALPAAGTGSLPATGGGPGPAVAVAALAALALARSARVPAGSERPGSPRRAGRSDVRRVTDV